MFAFKKIGYATLLVLIAAATHAQTERQKVTVADYARWSTLREEAISPNGLWVSYKLQYDYGPDTLFVQHVKTGQKLAFPSAKNSTFSTDSKYIAVTDSINGLLLRTLSSGRQQYYKNVLSYAFTLSAKHILIHVDNGGSKSLLLVDLVNGKEHTVKNVEEYSSGSTGLIAVINSSEVWIIDPGRNYEEKVIARDSSGGFKKLYWSENANVLAFLQKHVRDSLVPENYKIWWYDVTAAKGEVLDSETDAELKPFHIISKLGTLLSHFLLMERKSSFCSLRRAKRCRTIPYKFGIPLHLWNTEWIDTMAIRNTNQNWHHGRLKVVR